MPIHLLLGRVRCTKLQGGGNMNEKIYCPVNGWDCPYWRKDGTCSMYPDADPIDECDDFATFWDKDDDYVVRD